MKYKVESVKTENEPTVYEVVETRNPQVSQHSGYYSTRNLAIKAMRQICWGETPEPGDVR